MGFLRTVILWGYGSRLTGAPLCELVELCELCELRELSKEEPDSPDSRNSRNHDAPRESGYASNLTSIFLERAEPSRSLSSRGAQDLAETVIIHVTSRKETDMRFRVTPEVTLNLLCNPRDLSGVVPNRARMPLTPSVARHTGLDSPSPCQDAR